MTITAAGKAHMAELDARRAEHRQQAFTARLADDIAHLHRWDLVHTTYRRGDAERAGHVIDLIPGDDDRPDRVALLEITHGGGGADLGGVDATLVEPCPACDQLPRGAWDTRRLVVEVSAVVGVTPCRDAGTRLILSHKLAAAAAGRRAKTGDQGYEQLVRWASELAGPER